MQPTWEEAKWIFEVDGSLRDIYVLQTSLGDWSHLIDLLNADYSANIDKDYALAYLTDASKVLEPLSAKFHLSEIAVHCHFFCATQIELDVDPREVNSATDLQHLIDFLQRVSRTIGKPAILTGENCPELPLLTADWVKAQLQLTSEAEAEAFWRERR